MLSSHIDHLVITAGALELGEQYVREALGVELQTGGKHLRMATHNKLLKLGPELYLEVLSIDPDAEGPNRPRWFGLDEHVHVAPRLATWVIRTNDIHAAAADREDLFGRIEEMSRGEFRWLITVRMDGGMAFGGVVPVLIEWKTSVHPASKLEDRGCSLIKLQATHPQAEEISKLLQSIGFHDDRFSIQSDSKIDLTAKIETASGIHELVSGAQC
jgi:hypothetical protein